jgi:hypothetical protein
MAHKHTQLLTQLKTKASGMNYLTFLSLFLIVMTGCAPGILGQTAAPENRAEDTYSPCEDERYLELKTIDLDQMSEREYEFFLNKDHACNDYAESHSNYGQADTADKLIEHSNKTFKKSWKVAGIFTGASLLLMLLAL